MAAVVWACLGEAGAFPDPPRLEHSGRGLTWGPQFCVLGPGLGLASGVGMEP